MIIQCGYCLGNIKRKPSDVNLNNYCNVKCFNAMRRVNGDKTRDISKFIKTKWTNMNIRCGKFRHLATKDKNYSYAGIKLTFTREEFKLWCYDNTTVIRGLKRPSIDRVDSSKDYMLSNMRIIELSENISREKKTATLDAGRCYSCKLWKKSIEFHKDSRRWCGFSTLCRLCSSRRKISRSTGK